MEHSNHTNFFKDAARYHLLLGNGELQQHFFRSGVDEELNIHDRADLPCLILYDYFGAIEEGSDVKDVMAGSFEIRGKVDSTKDFEAIDSLKEQCKDIGMDILNLMVNEYERSGNHGPIPGFYLSAVTYDFTGPFNGTYYGCKFNYPLKSEAFNKYTFNKGAVFPGMT